MALLDMQGMDPASRGNGNRFSSATPRLVGVQSISAHISKGSMSVMRIFRQLRSGRLEVVGHTVVLDDTILQIAARRAKGDFSEEYQ